MRTARLAACLFALVAGCIPNDHPRWLIDHPFAWGIVASVDQPGPYSSTILVPEGKVRASALPLDTLELHALVVAPPDTPPLPPPIWIACVGILCGNSLDRGAELPPACPSPLPLSQAYPCRLGEGERVHLTLGGAFSGGPAFTGSVYVLAVGSADPDLSSETCLERLASYPRDELQRCLIQTRELALGPAWAIVAFAPELAQEQLVEIPADWIDEPPDVHPDLLHFAILRRTAGGLVELEARDGDDVTVRVGDRITVTAVFADDAAQSYYNPVRVTGSSGLYQLEPAEEKLSVRMALTELVDDFDYHLNREGGLTRSFTIPDLPGPIVLHAYITDARQGRAAASFRFLVERPTDAP